MSVWTCSMDSPLTNLVQLICYFLHQQVTFGGCFSSSAGTIWAFSMGGFIQQEMDNECFCSDRDSAMLVHWVMLNSTASINAVVSISFEEKKTAFQVIRLHPALISLKLQPLNPLRYPSGMTKRHNLETSFQSCGFVETNATPCAETKPAEEDRFAEQCCQISSLMWRSRPRKQKTEQAKTKAWQVPEVFTVCHAVFKRGFVRSKIFHCRGKKTELKHLNAKWGKYFSGWEWGTV